MRRRPVSSFPIATFGEYDSVDAIKSVLRQLKSGQFQSASALADGMSDDDRIDAVVRTRVGALMGTDLDIKPVSDKRKAVQAAELLGGVEDGPGEWDRMFPPGVVVELLRSGDLLNFGLAEIQWTSERGMWWPRLKFWDTQFVFWDEQRQCYMLRTTTGDVQLPRLDQNPVGDGQWFIWNPFGYQYAWRRGMIRSLASKYMMRQWDQRDWARYCEVHGLPLRKAVVPGGGGPNNTAAQDAFFEAVANVGNEPTVMVPQGVEGQKYDVEMVEATSRSWETFKEFKSALDIDIAVLVLGQNLTTEATGGGLGGGEVSEHGQIKREKLREDAAIAVAFRDQVLVPWAQFNFGDPDLAPRPVYRVDPPEDDGEKAKLLISVGQGLKVLQDAKVPVSVRATAEEFRINLMTKEEEAQAKADAEEEVADQHGASDATEPGGEDDDAEERDTPRKRSAEALAAKRGRRVFVTANVSERYDFAGLPIAVEHAAGTTREFDGGVTVQMIHDYGFIEGHLGMDGDQLDVYIGPNEAAESVFIVHQLKAPGFAAADEDKIFLGFDSLEEARASYLAHRGQDGEKAIGSIDAISIDAFKAKLERRTGGGTIKAAFIPNRRLALLEMDRRARDNARASGRRVAVRRSS
ncbi:MAG: DUF935 family protein [Pseudomonadota bacterium]